MSASDFFGTHPEFVEYRFGPPLVTKQASGENSHVPETDPEEVINEGSEGSGLYVPSTYAVFEAA